MSIQAIEELAQHPAPGFWCSGTTIFGPEEERFLIRVQHKLNPPASSESLAEIERLLGSASNQAQAFYRQHDGCLFYQSTLTETAGIELFPVAQWEEATAMMRGCFGDLSPADDPDCIRTGVAIAEVPQSGNYFVIPVEGPQVGKVFYANHDGWYESPFAGSFDEFLRRLTEHAGRLLSTELGGYTCYWDGQSGVQWAPERYVADVGNSSS